MTNRSLLFWVLGILILSGGGAVVYEKTRGIRNNNPGNIKKGQGFVGELISNDSTFAQFDTMAHGVRAIAKILLNYQSLHNLHTVHGIITRWSATDQEAYVQNVSDALGVGPDDYISVADYLFPLIRAIIKQENGLAGELVSDADIETGIAEVYA